MFDKLESVVNRYEQIGMELTRPDIASNNELFRKLMKEHSDLTPIVEKYREYKTVKEQNEEVYIEELINQVINIEDNDAVIAECVNPDITIKYEDGIYSYIIAPQKLQIGDKIVSSKKLVDVKILDTQLTQEYYETDAENSSICDYELAYNQPVCGDRSFEKRLFLFVIFYYKRIKYVLHLC